MSALSFSSVVVCLAAYSFQADAEKYIEHLLPSLPLLHFACCCPQSFVSAPIIWWASPSLEGCCAEGEDQAPNSTCMD